jgi:hypothetical protein
MQAANPGLAFAELTHRGYATLSLTRQAAETEIWSFSGWREPTATPPSSKRLVVEAVRGPGVTAWADA